MSPMEPGIGHPGMGPPGIMPNGNGSVPQHLGAPHLPRDMPTSAGIGGHPGNGPPGGPPGGMGVGPPPYGHAPPMNFVNMQPGVPTMAPYVPAPPMGGPPMAMFPAPGASVYQTASVYQPTGHFPPQQQPPPFGGLGGGQFAPPPQQPWQPQAGGQAPYGGYQQPMSLPAGIGPGPPFGGHSSNPNFNGYDEGQYDPSPSGMFGGAGYPGPNRYS